MQKLLIANRGEIAIRIARTAAELGIATVMIHSGDDAGSLHVRAGDEAIDLGANGVSAYLDIARIAGAAKASGCDGVHPGYGFLSESAAFAQWCEQDGIVFVGPDPEALKCFGDKAAARRVAEAAGVPVLPGVSRAVTVGEARAFLRSLGDGRAVLLKALAGGGGRGMRVVETEAELENAFERCASEAGKAFGASELYVEQYLPRARHIEVQIIGDGQGGVSHLWDRECSLQRQRQKLVEIAPAFGLDPRLREDILAAAVRIAAHVGYRGLGTVEFLVGADGSAGTDWVFMEANPRIQVEHTVTEEVLGLDLVAAQLRIACGAHLGDLGLVQEAVPEPSGSAVQVRVNMERMAPDGLARPARGVLRVYEVPNGPGIRVDGFGYAGYATSTDYDSLLAKVIARAGDLDTALKRVRRALSEFRIEGVDTNIPFLRALLGSSAFSEGALHTRYVDDNLADLLAGAGEPARHPVSGAGLKMTDPAAEPDDPLAVLSVRPGAGVRQVPAVAASDLFEPVAPEGTEAARAPLTGKFLHFLVAPGDIVRQGQPVAILEAMKMEHEIPAPVAGTIQSLAASPGAAVAEGAGLLFIEPGEAGGAGVLEDMETDPDAIRPDLARIEHMRSLTLDAARADAVARRHAAGKRTARENIEDLCDPATFFEYGQLVTISRSWADTPDSINARLLKAPGDGLVMGVGRVNSARVGAERARCVALAYDYTVLAGTQGKKNHDKTDRMLEVAEQHRLPVVFFTEGGGGRSSSTYPGDPPAPPTSTGGLKFGTWHKLGKLSGLVPLVGIVSGRCFAGNVVALALCDVIIATRDATLGIGGPAMIEGGGLGQFAPEEVGPVSVQSANGVIDIVVEDEADATEAAKQYLSYFQGRVPDWEVSDQRILRSIVPENRRAPYDVRKVIETIADVGSVLELRRAFGESMVTALVRIEGCPLGIIANNNRSPTGGAVDSDGADKAARFMQLCDAFDIPIATLIDVPGNMVGPEAEKTATIRHCGRLYVTGANLTVPMFSIVLRKAYGLGALAMSGGGFDVPFFVVSWPTGEFAGMGLEGQVKLGHRAELAAIEDVNERRARYEQLVGRAYEWANAANGATVFEFDDVIDPVDTRSWLAMGLSSVPEPAPRTGKKRSFIDTW